LNQGWYKVIFNNKICYIRSDFLKLTELPYENVDSPNTPKFYRHGKSTGVIPSPAALNGASSSNSNAAAVTVSGTQILNEAKKYLGTPYVNGGASPAGFDCSGFVYYVLKTLGFSPYRTPADQYKHGYFVDKSSLQPGDIVFFANTYGSGISHVGIYAGNGQFIHSPNSRSVVSYSDLTSGYWANHYYGARRVA
jgi:peptidoglycan endopeptidase LytE